MDPKTRQSIHHGPPNHETACIRNVKLPEASPTRTTLAEYPAVIDAVPRNGRRFCGQECSQKKRHFQQVHKHIERCDADEEEGKPRDPPPADGPPWKLPKSIDRELIS